MRSSYASGLLLSLISALDQKFRASYFAEFEKATEFIFPRNDRQRISIPDEQQKGTDNRRL
jgi:hypothetical protein